MILELVEQIKTLAKWVGWVFLIALTSAAISAGITWMVLK